MNGDLGNPDYGRRDLPIAAFAAIAIAYLAIIKGAGPLTEDRADVEDGRLLTVENVVWGMIVPLGIACAFVYLVITYLGWWRRGS